MKDLHINLAAADNHLRSLVGGDGAAIESGLIILYGMLSVEEHKYRDAPFYDIIGNFCFFVKQKYPDDVEAEAFIRLLITVIEQNRMLTIIQMPSMQISDAVIDQTGHH